ncbi:MAG: hypothetical protein MUC92_05830 [Fimbriimonadaceae bacterium]|nr:hypothetical protein [Fimbriimonadaceae bacterium]
MRISSWACLALSGLVLAGCGGGGGGGPVSPQPLPTLRQSKASEWVDEALISIEETRGAPTISSRMLGMVSTAMYDAWAAYDPVATSVTFGNRLRRPEAERTERNREIAVCMAAYRVLSDLYQSRQSRFASFAARQGINPQNTSLDPSTPEGVGNMVADELLRQRRNDGSNQANGYADTTGYKPVNTVDQVNDPNQWQPMRFIFPDGTVRVPTYLTPHWGLVRPFAVTNGAEFRCPPPPAYGTSAFQKELMEVYDVTSNLTDSQKLIAEYWAGGPGSVTPPGLWMEFAQKVSRDEKYSLEKDVKLFFLVGNAVMDAGICCWDSKLAHNQVRPITAMRFFFRGQKVMSWRGPGSGFGLVDASQWRPFQPDDFITPPFPDVPSGHSTFSAAAGDVMRRFKGSDSLNVRIDYASGSSKHDPLFVPVRPTTLNYRTITEAVNDAALSRLYGGIHFRTGMVEGLTIGRKVGDRVWNKANSYFRGEISH